MKKGLLVILSGPSGVGKGTIRKELMEKYPQLNLHYSISMTTREPRAQEIDGIDYFFVDRPTFEQNIKDGKFLEYQSFVGNYYGTPKEYVSNLLDSGINVLLEIEVNGAKQVMSNFVGDNIVSIFLTASIEEIKKRITSRRTESPMIIEERLNKAKSEFCACKYYDFVVCNDKLDVTTKEIADIIEDKIYSLNSSNNK